MSDEWDELGTAAGTTARRTYRGGPPKRRCASRVCVGSGWVISYDPHERHCKGCVAAITARQLAALPVVERPATNPEEIPW